MKNQGSKRRIYGYVRVSDHSQNLDRQLFAMSKRRIPKTNIFVDELSGKNTARPALQELMSTVRQGDTVLVESISRFARNVRDLLELIAQLTEKGVEFISLKEHMDTTTPTGKFMLIIFGAVAELEREYILQRQAEGIAAAKLRGTHLGRPIKKIPIDFDKLIQAWERKELSLPKVLEQCGGICEATFFRRLRVYRQTKER